MVELERGKRVCVLNADMFAAQTKRVKTTIRDRAKRNA
jgi:hypothetical protein